MLSLPADLEHEHEGVVVVRPTFGITLFSAKAISEYANEVNQAFSRYREVVGDEALRFFSTATMRKHRKVTKRSLSLLTDWFGPEAPPSEEYGIEYIDADPVNEAPRSRFAIFGEEDIEGRERTEATMVRLVLPFAWGTERVEEAFSLVEELCDLIPFSSGQAGFAFEPSRYFIGAANEFAIPKSMRHPGFDVHNQSGKEGSVGKGGVRSVGWLTMLSDEIIAELGGAPELEHCSVSPVFGGVILRAGAAPAVGDVNRKDDLPAYREAYAYVEPIAQDMPEKAPWFTFSRVRGAGDRTEAWYTRFST